MITRSVLRSRSAPVLVALALLFGQSAAALAAYDSRASEAKDRLEEANLPEEEREALQDALDRYFDARDDCLTDLVEIVEESDGEEQASDFQARAEECAVEGAGFFDDALDDFDPPSEGAFEFVNVFQAREGVFMGGLSGLAVAQGRDAIVATRGALANMIENLGAKWKQTKINDKTLDERAAQETRAVRKLLKKAMSNTAKANKDIVEKLRGFVKTATGSAVSWNEEWTQAIATGIHYAITIWEANDDRIAERTRVYESLFKSERKVIVTYTQIRGDVEEFLEETNYPKAEAAYNAAEESLDDFVAAADTSGQEDDADDFHDDVMSALKGHLDETQDTYEKFVSENEDKFFGAVGPDVKKEILEPDAWRSRISGIRSFSLDSKLREWREQATNYFEVDLSVLTKEQRRDLSNGLEGVTDDLAREMKEAGTSYKELLEALEEGRENAEDALD